jgi:glycosyltransferase involved in cell wall biosynthesis
MMVERVALLAPFTAPSVRGNAITVDRIARGLRDRGVGVRVWDVSVTPQPEIEAEVHDYAPTLIHAFHAWRVGPLALRLARRAELPLVVTLTGTDANHDLADPARAATVREVLEGAAAVVAFHESIARRITSTVPAVAGRITVIPQGVRLAEGAHFDLDAVWPLPAARVLFVFPAGIREIKRPRLPLGPFRRLLARHASARLLYVGPVLEPAEGEALASALEGQPWTRWIGPVPHDRMSAVLAHADVVLNCSISEGGMANSVLEALALGRAVLVSDIEGNRSLIEPGVTGLVFSGEADFEASAERLIVDPALRSRLGRAGRERVLREFRPEREIDAYQALYRRLAAPVLTR